MSSTYNGVAAQAPKTVTIVDDGDAAAIVSGMGSAIESCLDRSAIMTVAHGYQTLSDALLFAATAPSSDWTTDSGLGFTLPAGMLATDIIEVECDFEGASAGANDAWFAIGFKASTDANNQMWATSTRKVTATATRTRLTICSSRDCSGLGTGISLAALRVSVFAQPQGSDDAQIYGPGTFRYRVIRKA
jgi:hypothetical protein